MEKSITLVKVGNDQRPASQEDINDIAKQLKNSKDGDIIVTHHAVTIESVALTVTLDNPEGERNI